MIMRNLSFPLVIAIEAVEGTDNFKELYEKVESS